MPPYDSDVAVIGTGVAPLIAAKQFISEGRSVLILNPDWDFFREDSELPLDPLWPFNTREVTPQRLSRSQPDRALQVLGPDFPGSIELWPETRDKGFHDLSAPHVRSRARLWLNTGPKGTSDRPGAAEFWESYWG